MEYFTSNINKMKQITILLLLLSAVVLSGCGKEITNQEIVEQCNFCKENWYECDEKYTNVWNIFIWKDPTLIWMQCVLPTS